MSDTSNTDDAREITQTTALDLIEEQAEASIRRSGMTTLGTSASST